MTTNNVLDVGLKGSTGSGSFAGSTSPTFVTPVLGTPTSGTLTNCTGLVVAGGGTGQSSLPTYAVLCGGTTSTGAVQSVSGLGTSGYVLTSNGASALPTWQAGGGGGSVTAANIQNQAFTYAVDSGAADAYVIALSPALSSYADGQYVAFRCSTLNTGASTIDVNGLGAKNIYKDFGAALVGGELLADVIYLLQYSTSVGGYQIINPTLPAFLTVANLQDNTYLYGTDGGHVTNAIHLTSSSLLDTPVDGSVVYFRNSFAANTGATTLQIGSGSTINIATENNAALVGGELLLNGSYAVVYNSSFSAWVLINSSLPAGATDVQVQQAAFNYSTDSGAVDAYAATLTPAIAAYTDGLIVIMQASINNTIAIPTLAVNGLAAMPIALANLGPLVANDIEAAVTQIYMYDSTTASFILLNPQVQQVTPVAIQNNQYNVAADSGSANAYVGAFTPVVTAVNNGATFCLTALSGTNTGASTLDVGLGATGIVDNAGVGLIAGAMVTGQAYQFLYMGSAFQLLNSAI